MPKEIRKSIVINPESWAIIRENAWMLEVLQLEESNQTMAEVSFLKSDFRKVIDVFHTVGYKKANNDRYSAC